MNAPQTAAALAPREFILLCSYLDTHYGEEARYFDVLDVVRYDDGRVGQIRVELRWGQQISLNAAMLGVAA